MRKIEIKITRNEVIIMQRLYNSDCNSSVRASTIRKITAQTELSYYTVRNLLKALVYGGYCAKGCSSGNAETYYITKLGVDKLISLGVNKGENL